MIGFLYRRPIVIRLLRRHLSHCLLLMTFAWSSCWCSIERTFAQHSTVERPDVDFENEILPILTKAGCNTGACHGAAIGRGGFKLSLYGQNPDADWIEVARSLSGRRVNQVQPEMSLLLRKGGEFIEHGGGQRLGVDGGDWRSLVDWIASGAKRHSQGFHGRLLGISVSPKRVQVAVDGKPIRFQVSGQFEDGSQQDLTRWAVLQSQDPGAIRVLERAGEVECLRSGRHVLLIRVRDQIAMAEIIVPQSGDGGRRGLDLVAKSPVDRHVNELLSRLGLDVGDVADELTLLRRVTLDLTGRLPTLREIRTFAGDQRTEKLARLVDRLLASEGLREKWGHWLSVELRAGQLDRRGGPGGRGLAYLEFLKEQLDAATPLPELFARMVEADGDFETDPMIAFYLGSNNGREQTERFANLFMGVRIGCANCHNHPFDRWTQDDYHGLAALFAGIRRGETVTWKPGAENIHPANGEAAVGRLPDGKVVDVTDDPRPILANWVRTRGRRPIARAWANRVWAELFGRGLVDAPDDMRVTNPPTHPELLDELTDRWEEHGSDLKWLLRELVLSETYQRESLMGPGDQQSPAQVLSLAAYGYRKPKRLATPILLDAYSQVTDVWISANGEPLGTPAISRVAPERVESAANRSDCETIICDFDLDDSLSGRLAVIVGPLLNARLSRAESRITKWGEDDSLDDAALVEKLYLHCFGRPPSRSESKYWVSVLGESVDRSRMLEDIAWSMLTSTQFTTNY